MVVLLIIALLASILIPSVTEARKAAKTAQSKATVYALSSAVHQYRSTEELGRTYPPSLEKTVDIGNPYEAPGQNSEGMPTGDFDVWGAQLLVWALAGPDLLGTAGFDDPLNVSYALDGDTGQPIHRRFGPFVDVGKTKIKRITETPVPTEDVPALKGAVPAFVDAFDMPILYYKADTTRADIYRLADNTVFTVKPEVSNIRDQSDLNAAIEDPRLAEFSGHPGPYNRDSFILLSSGPDTKYGTSDDVANFERK